MLTCSMKKSDLLSTERIEMEVCEEYKKNRRKWMRRYAELERRYKEADRNEQWDRAERIGDALADMEQNSGFQKCLMCRKKGCPAHFDGFASWEPMDENLHHVRI